MTMRKTNKDSIQTNVAFNVELPWLDAIPNTAMRRGVSSTATQHCYSDCYLFYNMIVNITAANSHSCLCRNWRRSIIYNILSNTMCGGELSGHRCTHHTDICACTDFLL